MRTYLIVIAAVFGFLAAALPAQAGPAGGIDIVREPTTNAIKICSPFVPNMWRAATMVPSSWTYMDCRDFAVSVGATATQVGCVYSTPPAGLGQKFSWAPVNRSPLPGAANCGWPAASGPPGAFGGKICSPFVPNMWRSVTLAIAAWTPADCQAFARSIGATHVQLGCLFSEPTASGRKFAWSRRITGVNSPVRIDLQFPAPDCGWQGESASRRTPFLSVCSPYVPNMWRSATVVPPNWTAAECHAYARGLGATAFQIGCLFETAPAGSDQKHAWGPGVGINARFGTTILPPHHCGWRVS